MERSPLLVHLVIPCFKESGRIQPFLESLCAEMEKLGGVSLLVVDDGSGAEETSRLRSVVDGFRGRHPFVREMLELPENVGKGGTVYAGWEAHAGERWIMFVDADGSVSASEVARVIRLAREENHATRAYFASRVAMLGHQVERM
jgi:dolichyl-phosphate beta-glucosyltransferase